MSNIKVYYITSENARNIKEDLMFHFPSFIKECQKEKAAYKISYSNMAGARFEKEYGMVINEFITATFFTKDEPGKKFKKRTLGVS
jgi:hypothetical protein